MHKAIFGTVVIALAGTCWVLAQNASSKGWNSPSPYHAQPPMMPDEKAAALVGGQGDPLVAPTTELNPPPLPPLPDEPDIAIPPRPNLAREVRPQLPETSKSALPGLPPLPPVPGMTNPPAALPPSMTRSNYENIVVPQPAKPMWIGAQRTQGPTGPPSMDPTPGTPGQVVDPPGYWQERQRYPEGWDSRTVFECNPGPRIWGSADYLLWFAKAQSAPPLIQAITGVQPGDTTFTREQTLNLFPYNGNIDYGIMSGVRGTVGFWFNETQSMGFEATYMWFAPTELRDAYFSNAFAILGRPVIEQTTGGTLLYQVTAPGSVEGVIAVKSSLQLQGGEANFLANSVRFGPQFNLIAGFRYLEIAEKLRIDELSLGSNFTLQSFDQFDTRNQFWGGQLGLRWAYAGTRLSAVVTGKIGFGAINERVFINGNTSSTLGGTPVEASGGVLALNSNIGTYNRTTTAWVPEFALNLGYRLAPWATINVGYNFLYVSEMVRPGSQIDMVVNTNNLPFVGGSSGRPGFSFKSDDFWVQGINFGLTFQY